MSDLVRDTEAVFSSAVDKVVEVDPTAVPVVGAHLNHFRRAQFWLEARRCMTPVAIATPGWSTAHHDLADPLDYPLKAVGGALDSDKPRPRILLVDVVGLGKTIEIGMISSELVRRGHGDRFRIIMPKRVLEQRQMELWTRFSRRSCRSTRQISSGSARCCRAAGGRANHVGNCRRQSHPRIQRQKRGSTVERAYDLTIDRYVSAFEAEPHPGYLCPCCCGRVHLRPGKVKVAHFAHNHGEVTSHCEEYHPGSGTHSHYDESTVGSPLYLHVDDDTGDWTLYLELPPLTASESRRSVPSAFGSGRIELHQHGVDSRRVGATVLWPGSGRNTITVPPSRHDSQVRAAGRWPTGIQPARWQRTLRGLPSQGVLFVPYRGGSYRRYGWSTPIHWGDRLVLVGTRQSAPPPHLHAKPLNPRPSQGTDWSAWLIMLPTKENGSFSTWLARFGVAVEDRRSRTRIVTPAVEYGADGTPHFYVDEPLVVIPSPQATAIVAESRATISARRLQRRTRTAQAAFSITTVESGTLHLRTDAKQDTVRAEMIAETSVPMEDFSPVWSVMCGEAHLQPFTTHRSGSRSSTVKVVSEIKHLRFRAAVRCSSGTESRLDNATATELTDWVATHLEDTTRVLIDAGNFGFVRIDFGEPHTTRSKTSVATPDRSGWQHAYALAAASASDPAVPHWQFRNREARPNCREHRFRVFE
ncbi:competence protein CoiA family protein [Rhodococcus ruber]